MDRRTKLKSIPEAEVMTDGPLSFVAPPPPRRLPLLQAIKVAQVNSLAIIPAPAFELPVFDQSGLLGRNYIVSDPAAVRRVLLDNALNYPKAEGPRRAFAAAFGDGILTSEGAVWKAHRSLMSPAFWPRSMTGYETSMNRVVEALVREWTASPRGVVDLSRAMYRTSLQVISSIALSGEGDDVSDLTLETLRAAEAAMLPFTLADLVPGLRRRRARCRERQISQQYRDLDAWFFKTISARRGRPAAGDVLDRLLGGVGVDGAALSERQIRDEILTIFVAGHDTTAVALAWTLYLISRHQAVEERLVGELNRVLAGRAACVNDLTRLPYLRMVIEETLRLLPAVPRIPLRTAQASDELAGHPIPAGAHVSVMPWVLHRHRRLWDHPERFDPERFERAAKAARSKYAYLPFGAGPRACIGATLAMTEISVIVAGLIQAFRFESSPDQRIVLRPGVTLRPQEGLKMRISPRGTPRRDRLRATPTRDAAPIKAVHISARF